MINSPESKLIKRGELAVLSIALLVLLVGTINAGLYARRERRDGQVRADLRQLKTEIEMYYNQHEQYPLTYDSGSYRYVVTEKNDKEAIGWYVAGQLENATKSDSGFNEEYNIDWRVTKQGEYEICGGTLVCADSYD